MTELLLNALGYLFAAVVAVSITKRLGLGSVLGYLLAGVAIGPILGLVGGHEMNEVQHVAELGVVMMLFLIGLELEPTKLWALRKLLLGMGGLQVLLSVLAITGIAVLFKQSWQVGVAIGCILSLSSTAIVMQSLGEKGLLSSAGGRSSFAVLLFQDIAAIPMLTMLPLLALPELGHHHAQLASHSKDAFNLLAGASNTLKVTVTVLAMVTIVGGGHFLNRPLFRFIASSRLRELFTLTALTLVIGVAVLMSLIGLSPALGTFLVGVVLANSDYRHELKSNIEPFKGIFLGLFFITVGAGINVQLLFGNIGMVLALTVGMMFIKMLVLYALSWVFRLDRSNRLLFTFGLAQAGEFGFVLISLVSCEKVIPSEYVQYLSLVVALSMLLTPLLFVLYDYLVKRLHTPAANTRKHDEINEENPVIVLGQGRFGQIIVGMLTACGYKTTVIDHDVDTVEGMRSYGIKTYFGDATRMELLETAGLAKARLLVIAIGKPEQARLIAEQVRRLRPDLPLVIRAYDRRDTYDLYQAIASHGEEPNADIVRETFDSAIRAGRLSLQALGVHHDKAMELANLYYHRDRHVVKLMAKYYDPSLPLWRNAQLLNVAKENDVETYRLMRQLMTDDTVDWDPELKEQIKYREDYIV